MPDWQKLVRQRISNLALDAVDKDEVQVELAAHLEESYESLRTKGLPEQEAMQQTLAQVEDWQDLRRKVQDAKKKENIMNDRVRQLWLPGFLALVMSSGILALIEIYGTKPVALMRVGRPPIVLFFIPWLLSLPLVGAVGAYLSHRAGGSRRAIFSTIVFPVLPYLAFFLLAVPVTALFNESLGHNIMFLALFFGLLAWVVAPGAALLVGGLLVHLLSGRRSSPQDTAIG